MSVVYGEQTVLWSEPTAWDTDHLVDQIRQALPSQVLEAYLFGSHATGTATSLSDIDLILVAPTDRPWPERGKDYLHLFDTFSPLDLIIYTPQEWATLKTHPNALLESARASLLKIL